MAFPDERDRNIIRRAEQVENLATELCDWLSEYNPARRRTELLPVNESDEFEVLQLRRLASSLYTSSKVPVAAAAYGATEWQKRIAKRLGLESAYRSGGRPGIVYRSAEAADAQ
jgi:hypothetical protein